MEDSYGLIRSFPGEEPFVAALDGLLREIEPDEERKERSRSRMLEEKLDVVQWVVDLIEEVGHR